MINRPHINYVVDCCKIFDNRSSLQSQLVVTSVVINTVNSIWVAKSNFRFQNSCTNRKSACASIVSQTALSNNNNPNAQIHIFKTL